MTEIECPLSVCAAGLTLVVIRTSPGDTTADGRLVPEHSLQTTFALPSMPCPASLMSWPLTAYARQLLDQQDEAIKRLAEADADAPVRPRPALPVHGRRPQPDADPYWFRNSGGGKPSNIGHVGRPVFRLLPADGAIPPERGTPVLASVDEFKAILLRAQDIESEALVALAVVSGKAATALQMLNVTRIASGHDFGTSALVAAVEKLDEAAALIQTSSENVSEYIRERL